MARDLTAAISGLVGRDARGPSALGPVLTAPNYTKTLPAGFEFLAGAGEMGQLIGQHSWADTPLGPIEKWPQILKTSVSLILNSQHPMWVGWGPSQTFLYNDAYISVHSGSKTASLRIEHGPQNTRVEIRDEGKGISQFDAAKSMPTRAGVGVQGMQERVRQLQGKFEISSGEKGTTITVVLPNRALGGSGKSRRA